MKRPRESKAERQIGYPCGYVPEAAGQSGPEKKEQAVKGNHVGGEGDEKIGVADIDRPAFFSDAEFGYACAGEPGRQRMAEFVGQHIASKGLG